MKPDSAFIVSDGREMKIISYRDSPRVQVMKLYLLAHKLSTFLRHARRVYTVYVNKEENAILQYCNIIIYSYFTSRNSIAGPTMTAALVPPCVGRFIKHLPNSQMWAPQSSPTWCET